MKKRWETNELSAVSTISYGYTESATIEPIGPRFLRITDIQDDHVDWDSVPYCKIESADLPKYRLASGDIVFARTGATTGKSFLVADPPEAVFASYLIRLRLLDEKLLPAFVSLFFQSAGYWKSIKEGSAGSAQGGFNATKLGALSIPIPPLPEQQRIVDELEEVFASLATAQANAAENLKNARALFESHLQSVFNLRRKGWVEKPLGELCSFGSGGTPSKSNNFYWNGSIPWVSGRDMKATQLSDTALHISLKAVNESATRIAPAGSLLMLVRGMGLAHGAQIAELTVPCAFNQDIRAIYVKPTISPRYLLFALRTRINHSENVLSNAAHGTLKIDMDELRRVSVPVPSYAEQQRIAYQIDGLATESRRLESLHQKKQAALAALKKSLLHQAFSGEL